MENFASASGAISPVGYFCSIRVLAVDEDPIYLKTLTQMLKRCGYEVTAKASPEEALRELRLKPEGSFDLVLSVAYTRGTGIDGFGLLKQLKNRLPVILLSGDEPLETVKRGIHGGACDFLSKPLRDDEMHNIWKHVLQWRLKASNSADPRKRGSQRVVDDSDQRQQKQGRTTKETNFNWSPQLQESIVKAAEQLRGTEGFCPRGIRDLLEAQGIEVTTEQVTSHLEKYRRDNPINHLPAMSIAISPVGRRVLGSESYRSSHVGHLHNNGNHHGYGNHYGNGNYGNGYGHHYGSDNGNCNANANGNFYGNGRGGLTGNASMVSSSLPSILAHPVQPPMPNTGLFPSNTMHTMDNPNPIRQQVFPQISGLRYNARTGGISLSPWHVDDGDLQRSYLGENEIMQNTTTTGMTQGTHGDGVAGQTSAPQPQDLTGYFSWESTKGNGPTGTSGGSVVADKGMECALNEDGIDRFSKE